MRSINTPPPPRTYAPSTATVLTAVVLLLLPVATLVGLFVPGFYRDAASMIPQARGQDLVTLIVAEPLLLWALIGARRGHISAPLVWIGTLGYVLYTYAMYSYTAYFNALFLVYVALFSASLFALVDLLVHLDVEQLRAHVRPALPVRPVALFLAAVGLLFLVAWLGQIVPAILHGTVPDAVTQAKTPTSAVYVQDLGIVIPLMLLGAVWLWQRRGWGYALTMSLLVLSDVMLLAMLSMAFFMAQANISNALATVWLFAVLAAATLGATGYVFAHLGRSATPVRAPSPRGSAPSGSLPLPSAAHRPAEQARDAVSLPDR